MSEVSYTECRMMQLTMDQADTARQLSQEISDIRVEDFPNPSIEKVFRVHCRAWLSARLKLKDVKPEDFMAAWSQAWETGCRSALRFAGSEAKAEAILEFQTFMLAKFIEISDEHRVSGGWELKSR